MNTNFDHQEKFANVPIGPTASNPGPILLMVAATEVNVVTRLSPSKEITNTDATNKKRYATK